MCSSTADLQPECWLAGCSSSVVPLWFPFGNRRSHYGDAEAGLRPSLRSKQEIIIDAPLEAVWSFTMDLTKIPEFHPRVSKVDLIDGKAFREAGVAYQCHLSGGRHTCIERDIEIVPLEKSLQCCLTTLSE